MKKLALILTLALLLLLVAYWQLRPAEQKIYDSQINDQGEVTAEVKPLTLEKGKDMVFQVTLDTHSVELNYDLMKVARLTNNKGEVSTPISWDGGSGGHHLKGNLIFPKVSDKTKDVELVISQIEGVDRKFKWNL